MSLQVHMGRDQPDDPFHVRSRQPRAGVDTSFSKSVQPQSAIGIDHDFYDQGVTQRGGDLGAHGRAQHGAAALAAFGMSTSRAHSAASSLAGCARVTPSGVILATTSAAVRLPAAKRRPT